MTKAPTVINHPSQCHTLPQDWPESRELQFSNTDSRLRNLEFIQSCNVTLNDTKFMTKSVTLIITNNVNKNKSLIVSSFISQMADGVSD